MFLNRITFVSKRAVYCSASGERKLKKKREKRRDLEGGDPLSVYSNCWQVRNYIV